MLGLNEVWYTLTVSGLPSSKTLMALLTSPLQSCNAIIDSSWSLPVMSTSCAEHEDGGQQFHLKPCLHINHSHDEMDILLYVLYLMAFLVVHFDNKCSVIIVVVCDGHISVAVLPSLGAGVSDRVA